MNPAFRPLLAGFEIPDPAAWTEQAQKDLRGRALDDLRWPSEDGRESPPLFVAKDVAGLPHRQPNVAHLLERRRPDGFAIRQRIDTSRPALAARICSEAVNRGADELLLRLDHLAWHGVDPGILADAGYDLDLFDTDAGRGGCAIYHADSLDWVLGAVDLRATPIAVDAGASSLAILGMLLLLAERRGIPAADLRVELGVDPVRELVCGPTLGASASALVAECATAAEMCKDWPHVIPVAVHSHGFHRAGASPEQELACTIATAICYLRALIAAGIPAKAAARAICLRMSVQTDLYVEIAKLRAARLLWAKIARAFGCRDLHATIHAESSERSWSSSDVHTNLLRSSLQGFIAALAGCDSITLAPFDQNHDDRDIAAAAHARNQLVLLREESFLHHVQDPCSGSFAIEALTDQMARGAWDRVQDIEACGGIIATLEDSSVQEMVRGSATRRETAVRTRARGLVGINRFVDPRFDKENAGRPDPETIQHELFEHLATREPEVEHVAANVGSLVQSAEGGCTVGQITLALRGGVPLELSDHFDEFVPDGEPFECLRAMVRQAALRVRPVLCGDLRTARRQHDFARGLFQAGGYEVIEAIELGEFCDPDATPPTEQTPITILCGDVTDADLATLAAHPSRGRLAVTGQLPEQLRDAAQKGDDGREQPVYLFRGCDALHILRQLYLELTPAQGGNA